MDGIRFVGEGLRRVLYEVTPNDPGPALLAGGVLVAAALVACLPMARRGDPVEGQRAEQEPTQARREGSPRRRLAHTADVTNPMPVTGKRCGLV